MYNKYGIKLLLLIIVFSIYNFCCTNDKDTNYRGGEQSVMKLPHKYYSPLTLSRFNDIINNKQMFDSFYMGLGKQYNCDQEGEPVRVEGIVIQQKGPYGKPFDSINDYIAVFSKQYEDLPQEPDNYKNKRKEFSKNDVEIILAYLKNNSDYFFNNEEFQGISIPYEVPTDGDYLCAKRKACQYVFLLEFFEPSANGKDRGNYAWVICKCQEKPDIVFQGIIDIFEKKFISKFETQ